MDLDGDSLRISGPIGPPPATQGAVEVLVLDDSRAQRHLLHRLLRRWGYRATVCDTPEAALELLRGPRFSLIVSDWMMPGLTGPEFCRRFRAMERESYGYIILLTSMNDKGALAHGLDAGADDFASKPVNAGELRARLKTGERIIAMQRELVRKNSVVAGALAELKGLYDALDRDLLEAKRLQRSLLREPYRRFGASSVALTLRSSGHVGGDLVGFFPVTDTRVALFSLDVSGHGVTSAMLTARLAGLLEAGAPDRNIAMTRAAGGGWDLLPPVEVLRRLNTLMLDEIGTDLYFTLCFADADLATGKVAIAQGGHPHPAVLRRDGSVGFLGQGGMPVGLLPQAEFGQFDVTLRPGDRLLFCSDGITECTRHGTGPDLGETGLATILTRNADRRGPDLLAALMAELEAFAGGEDFADDVSALVLEFRDPPSRG